MTAYFRGPGGPQLHNPWLYVVALIVFVLMVACLRPVQAQTPAAASSIQRSYAVALGPDYRLVTQSEFEDLAAANNCAVKIALYDAKNFRTKDITKATSVQYRCEL